jgi:hypothetical protein
MSLCVPVPVFQQWTRLKLVSRVCFYLLGARVPALLSRFVNWKGGVGDVPAEMNVNR